MITINLPVSKEITVKEMIEWLSQQPQDNKLVLGELTKGSLKAEWSMFYAPAHGYTKDTTIIGVEFDTGKIEADKKPFVEITQAQIKIIKFIEDMTKIRFIGINYDEAYAFIGQHKRMAEMRYRSYDYPNAPKRPNQDEANYSGNEMF